MNIQPTTLGTKLTCGTFTKNIVAPTGEKERQEEILNEMRESAGENLKKKIDSETLLGKLLVGEIEKPIIKF